MRSPLGATCRAAHQLGARQRHQVCHVTRKVCASRDAPLPTDAVPSYRANAMARKDSATKASRSSDLTTKASHAANDSTTKASQQFNEQDPVRRAKALMARTSAKEQLIDEAKESRSCPDMLFAFTVAYGHCLALQVAKDAQVYGLTLPLGSSLILAAVIAATHFSTSGSTLLALASSGMLVLLLHGSQSNHVLLEMLVTLAVLLTAPAPHSWFSSLSAAQNEAQRAAWSVRLTLSMRALVVVLYWGTAFAKLNDDWHDAHRSCCVQMFVASIASWVDVTVLPPVVLRLMPFAATAFELSFPVALLGALACEDRETLSQHSSRAASRVVLRCLSILGSAFHVLIALPPPPESVYPFSMLMLPIYIPALLPDDISAAMRAISCASRTALSVAAAVLAATVACALYLARASRHFEYPPYFSWQLGVLWVFIGFSGLVATAVAAPYTFKPLPEEEEEEQKEGWAAPEAELFAEVVRAPAAPPPPPPPIATLPRPSRARVLLALLPAALLLATTSTTYLGVRTYPSFAMFSNLRIEGGSSNHWIVRPGRLWLPTATAASLFPASHAHGPHHALEILSTDLPALRDLQVNLAPLLPATVLAAFAAVNVSAEFHITPPSWGYAPTETTFRPFSVPVVEVRRRLAAAAATTPDFYVRYRVVADGAAEKQVKLFRRKRGKLVAGSDAALEEPLSPLRAVLHRYRTFDTSYSPCRH